MYFWWFWVVKILRRLHKSCDCENQAPINSRISALFKTSMALGWTIFFTMKTLGSYVILVVIFYQLLQQIFGFNWKIHLLIDNITITIHVIMLCLPYIAHILNWYFKFIKSLLIFNSKQQPRQNLLKKSRKRFYRQKIKIRYFSPTKYHLLENTNKWTHPTTKQHSEINQNLLSNLCCYLAQKKHRREIVFDTDSFDICPNSRTSSCATPDEIDFIPGTYKNLTGITINGISEGIKVAGCRYVHWIFKDNKKENIELNIERILHIPGFPIRLISPPTGSKTNRTYWWCIAWRKIWSLLNF